MAKKGVTTVLTGNCGPNAFKVFGAAGIQVMAGVDGTVREAVQKFKDGGLKSANAPNVDAHSGTGDGGQPDRSGGMPPASGMPRGTGGGLMGAGSGMGQCGGRGVGRGMGRGGGKGCGTGRGMGMMGAGGGMTSPVPEARAPSNLSGRSKEEEMKLLKRSADDLRRQLDSIQNRMDEITKDQ
jgi:hypothetical protein